MSMTQTDRHAEYRKAVEKAVKEMGYKIKKDSIIMAWDYDVGGNEFLRIDFTLCRSETPLPRGIWTQFINNVSRAVEESWHYNPMDDDEYVSVHPHFAKGQSIEGWGAHA